VTAYSPAGASFRPNSTAPITVPENGSLDGQDVVLRDYQPLPGGVSVSPSRMGSLAVPRVSWNQTLALAVQGCSGGSASYQVTQAGAVLRSGDMTESPAGRYQAALAALAPYAGDAEARVTIQCPGGLAPTPDTLYAFDLFIEPDLTVRALGGRPLAGASVTLFAYAEETGSFLPVPEGAASMGPVNRANPDTTDESGRFGWDLSGGIYKIRAEKEGCFAPGLPDQPYSESDVLVFPHFHAIDLDLYLDCGMHNAYIYLPLTQH
jgi:hypothetical protein